MATDPNWQALLEALSALPQTAREPAAHAIAAELRKDLDVLRDSRGAIHGDLLLSGDYFAVHDDDLKFLSEAAAVAAAAYAAFPSPASVVSGLVVLLFRYWRKRVRLTQTQALVLQAIDAQTPRGATLDELRHGLPAPAQAHVAEALRSLMAARKEDGTEAKLVEERDGRYFALDV